MGTTPPAEQAEEKKVTTPPANQEGAGDGQDGSAEVKTPADEKAAAQAKLVSDANGGGSPSDDEAYEQMLAEIMGYEWKPPEKKPEAPKEEPKQEGGGWWGGAKRLWNGATSFVEKAATAVVDTAKAAYDSVSSAIEGAWEAAFKNDVDIEIKRNGSDITELTAKAKDGSSTITANAQEIVKTTKEGDKLTYDEKTKTMMVESKDGLKLYYKKEDGSEHFKLDESRGDAHVLKDRMVREKGNQRLEVLEDRINRTVNSFGQEIKIFQVNGPIKDYMDNPNALPGIVNAADGNGVITDSGLRVSTVGDTATISDGKGHEIRLGPGGSIEYKDKNGEFVALDPNNRENWPSWARAILQRRDGDDDGDCHGRHRWRMRGRLGGRDVDLDVGEDEEGKFKVTSTQTPPPGTQVPGTGSDTGGETATPPPIVITRDRIDVPTEDGTIVVETKPDGTRRTTDETGAYDEWNPNAPPGTAPYREFDENGKENLRYDARDRTFWASYADGTSVSIASDGTTTLWNGDKVNPDGSITSGGQKYFGGSPAEIQQLQAEVNKTLGMIASAGSDPSALKSLISQLGGQLVQAIKLGQFQYINQIFSGMSRAEQNLAIAATAERLEQDVILLVPDVTRQQVDARMSNTSTAMGLAYELHTERQRRLSA